MSWRDEDSTIEKFDSAYATLGRILKDEGSNSNVFLMNNFYVYGELEARGYQWDEKKGKWVKAEDHAI